MRTAVVLAAVLALPACSSASVDQAANSVASQAPTILQEGLLQATLRAKIAAIDVDAATNVGIADHAGHVKLTGAVRTAEEREKVVAAAKSIGGVTSVDDELRIDPKMRGTAQQAGDFALAAKVETALASQTGINAISVRTSAKDGVVTLRGTVPSDAIKATMIATAKGTSGVRQLVDGLAVKP